MKNSPFSGKKVKVLLLKPLLGKGNAGEIIQVKTHYALHVLIPNWVAVIYDKQTENQKQTQMNRIAKLKEEEQAQVKSMLSTVQAAWGLTFHKAATEENKLYDSITARSLLTYISKEYKIQLQPSNLKIEKIESLGDYVLNFNYQDISEEIALHVVRQEKAE